MEEALGFWWEDVDGCRSCSGVLAHQGDVFRVPTEDGDVFLDPLEGQDLILQPEVAGGGPVLGGKEPQGAQPVVHSNQHHVVVQEVLGSEGWLSVATCGEKFEKLSGIKWIFLWYTFLWTVTLEQSCIAEKIVQSTLGFATSLRQGGRGR